jgi:hypothetical protein
MDDIQVVMRVDSAPVDRAVRVMDNLEAELRDVERAMQKNLITEKQYNAETKRLTQSMNRLMQVSKGSAKDFRAFEKTVYGSGKAMRQKEIAMQQAGYQLQDFIVQVQAGTNPLIAFSQQGSQLAGFFAGPWGAAIGLGIAALGGLGTALLGTKGQTKSLLDITEDFLSVVENYNKAGDDASVGVDNLSEAFGTLAGTVKEARDAILELRRVQVEQEFQGTSKGFIDKYAITGGGDVRGELARIFGAKMYPSGFYMGEENVGGELSSVLRNVVFARETDKGPEARAIFLKNALVAAKELAIVDGNINDKEKELLETLEKMYSAYEGIIEKQEERNKLSIQVDAEAQLAKEKAMAAMQEEIGKGNAQRAKEFLELQAKLEKDLLDENLAYEKKMAKEAEALKRQIAKEDKILLEAQAKRELELMQENARYEAEQDKKRKQEREDNFINTLNYQYSLVEDTLGDLQDEMDTLKEAAEELGARLGMGFDQAVNLIRQAKAEATVDLDAFGGAGDFKYSVPTYFDPNKGKNKGKKKGKTPAQELDEYMTNLERTVKLEQKQVGVSEAVARSLELREEYEVRGLKVNEKRIEALVQEEEALRKAQEAHQQYQDTVDSIADAFGDTLMAVADGSMSIRDAFQKLMFDIAKMVYEQAVIDPTVDAIKAFLFQANGGVHSRGNVVPFANGGVVNGPTLFPMSGGTGLMGEAGPEAIMPLKRGKDGKLGVAGGSTTVVQNFNFSANGDESVKKIIASEAPKIANMTQQKLMDSRRRGGNMKQVFA